MQDASLYIFLCDSILSQADKMRKKGGFLVQIAFIMGKSVLYYCHGQKTKYTQVCEVPL